MLRGRGGELARRAGCKLTVCPQAENRSDRWIQVRSPWAVSTSGVTPACRPAPTQGLRGLSKRTRAASTLPRALLFLILDPELSLSRTFWRLRHTDVEYDIHSPTGSGLGTGAGVWDGRGGDAHSLPQWPGPVILPWKVVFAPGMLPNILQYTGQPHDKELAGSKYQESRG